MGKSTSVKREIRFQQWIQQVKEYNERPDGMSMSAWCFAHSRLSNSLSVICSYNFLNISLSVLALISSSFVSIWTFVSVFFSSAFFSSF